MDALWKIVEAKPFAVIGHRGAAGLCVENTISCVHRAIEMGVDGVEIDVRSTADGSLIVFHDADFSRFTRFRERVCDVDINWIKRNIRVNGEKIPLLEELLASLRGFEGVLMIELKENVKWRILRDTIQKYLPLKRTVILSFNVATLDRIKLKEPEVYTGLITWKVPERFTQHEVLLVHHSGVDRASLSRAEALGKVVGIWTVNDPKVVEGLDHFHFVVTDFPNLFLGAGSGNHVA